MDAHDVAFLRCVGWYDQQQRTVGSDLIRLQALQFVGAFSKFCRALAHVVDAPTAVVDGDIVACLQVQYSHGVCHCRLVGPEPSCAEQSPVGGLCLIGILGSEGEAIQGLGVHITGLVQGDTAYLDFVTPWETVQGECKAVANLVFQDGEVVESILSNGRCRCIDGG